MRVIALALAAVVMTTGCATVDTPQAGRGGATFDVRGKTSIEVWRAATATVSRSLTIVENSKDTGTIRAEKSSRWRMVGLVVDWQDYDRVYTEAGLIPPKDHRPVHEDWMVYDADRSRVGYATSIMYSPVLQQHIALARVRPDLAKPGTRLFLEFTVDHRYQQVAAHTARLPLYNPPRKTAP